MLKKLIPFISVSIVLIFCGIKFGLLSSHVNKFETSLSLNNFILWTLSMLSISLGALLYQENEKGYQTFTIFNFLGIGSSYYIGYRIGNFNLGTLVLIISALLFVYHSQLKDKSILGMLCLAFCALSTVIVYGVFELVSYIKQAPDGLHRLLFSIIADYSVFVFLLTIALAAIYNLKHSKTLLDQGIQTLDQQFGFTKSIKVIGAFLLLPTAACSYYLYTYMYQNNTALLFGLAFLLAPLLVACIKCFSVVKPKELKLIFILLQLVLVASACSLFVFRLS